MIGKLVESGTKVRSNKGESQNSALDSSPVTASSKKPTGVQKASISSASPLLICIYNVTVTLVNEMPCNDGKATDQNLFIHHQSFVPLCLVTLSNNFKCPVTAFGNKRS